MSKLILSSLNSVKRSLANKYRRPNISHINVKLRYNRTYGELIKEAGNFTCPISISTAEDTGYHHEGKDSQLTGKYRRKTSYTEDTGFIVCTKSGLIVLGIFDGHGGDAYSFYTEKIANKLFRNKLDNEWKTLYLKYKGYPNELLEIEKNKRLIISKLAIEINKLTDNMIEKLGINGSGTTVNFVIIDRLSRSMFSYNLGDSKYMIIEPFENYNTLFHKFNETNINTYSKFNDEKIEKQDKMQVISTRDHSADNEIEKKRAAKINVPIYQDRRGTWRLDGCLMVTGGYGDKSYRGLRRAYSINPNHEDEGEIYRRDIIKGSIGILTTDGIFESLIEQSGFLKFCQHRIDAIVKYISENKNIPNLADGLIKSQLAEIESIGGDYYMGKIKFGGEPSPWINEWDNHKLFVIKFS